MAGSLREAMANFRLVQAKPEPIRPSFDVVARVRRCYNSGSEAEETFLIGAAKIAKAFKLGHIDETQAQKLMAML